MSEQTFWMVWNPQGRSPTFQHLTFEAAKCEAERLARNNPPHSFFILKSLGFVKKTDVEFHPAKEHPAYDPDLPF